MSLSSAERRYALLRGEGLKYDVRVVVRHDGLRTLTLALLFVPVVNLVMLWILAFIDRPEQKDRQMSFGLVMTALEPTRLS